MLAVLHHNFTAVTSIYKNLCQQDQVRLSLNSILNPFAMYIRINIAHLTTILKPTNQQHSSPHNSLFNIK